MLKLLYNIFAFFLNKIEIIIIYHYLNARNIFRVSTLQHFTLLYITLQNSFIFIQGSGVIQFTIYIWVDQTRPILTQNEL